jgi:hypothetical protein
VLKLTQTTRNTSPIFDRIVSATFEANGRCFTTGKIESLQVLQYRCIYGADLPDDTPLVKSASKFYDASDANLVLHCGSPNGAMDQSYTIKSELKNHFFSKRV